MYFKFEIELKNVVIFERSETSINFPITVRSIALKPQSIILMFFQLFLDACL